MAERLSDSDVERDKGGEQQASELESLAAKQPETTSEQIERDRERAERSERKAAEKLTELQTEKLEKKNERRETKAEKHEELKPSPEKEKNASKSELRQALEEELTTVRQHLTPAQRTLSQIVHNPIIERASEALEETVFRPSIVVGGAIGAILVGGFLYGFAKVRGYLLPGSEFVVGLVIGAVLGILAELLHWLIRGRKASK